MDKSNHKKLHNLLIKISEKSSANSINKLVLGKPT